MALIVWCCWATRMMRNHFFGRRREIGGMRLIFGGVVMGTR